jgi:hypothetical protein
MVLQSLFPVPWEHQHGQSAGSHSGGVAGLGSALGFGVPLRPGSVEGLGLAGGKVDWTAYPDQAAQELKALIEAKLAGQAGATPVPVPTILPLLEALKQSVGAQNEKETAPPVPSKASRKRTRRTA